MVDHENLVTISCFRTFLIFIQSYILNFAFILNAFFFTCLCQFFSFADINKKKRYIVATKKKVGKKIKKKSIINNELKALKC